VISPPFIVFAMPVGIIATAVTGIGCMPLFGLVVPVRERGAAVTLIC